MTRDHSSGLQALVAFYWFLAILTLLASLV